jgi:hypothetical protein
MQVTDAVRGVLDTSPSSRPDFIAEKEAVARKLLPPFHPGCGCLIPPDAGEGLGWHREINHPEVKSAEQYQSEARTRIEQS